MKKDTKDKKYDLQNNTQETKAKATRTSWKNRGWTHVFWKDKQFMLPRLWNMILDEEQ